MLTPAEKEMLYKLIATVMGDDLSIKSRMSRFNLRIVDVVEEMIVANENCNESIKKLVTDLLGGSATLAKGWLRTFIKGSKRRISRINFHGYGCSVATKSRWRSAIVASVI